LAEQKTALMTVTGTAGPPSLAEAAAQLGVSVEDLNAGFGVVPVDPAHGLFTVEVDADRIQESFDKKGTFRGPFSNPRIGHFGPPKSGSDDSDR
jgi:hypothetical protein